MKKIKFLSIIFLLIVVACKFNDTGTNNTPSDSQDIVQPDEIGTKVEFTNKTDFLVKVYSDSLRQTLLGEIESGKKNTFKAEYSKVGTPFYIDYYLIVNKLKIKFGDGTSIIQLKENGFISAEIPTLNNSFNNYTVIGVKNTSKSGIELMQYNKICFRDDGTSILNEKETDFFLFVGEIEATSLKISDAGNIYNFPENLNFENSNIYSFEYIGNGQLVLSSKVSFDPSINSKIWKIPLSQTTGKFLSADKFGTRENLSDGYFFTGQVSYTEDFRNEESRPYKAEISPTGEVRDSYVILRDSPKMVWSRLFCEKEGYRLVAGNKYDTKGIIAPFIYGDVGCDFYITPELENFGYADSLIYKQGTTFSLLYDIVDEDDSEKFVGFGIYELTIKAYNDVNGKIVYTNTDGDYEVQDFIYHDGNYIVLSNADTDKDGVYDTSDFLFITPSGNEEYELNESQKKTVQNYAFDRIELADNGNYAVAVGSYLSNRTGKDIASFIQLDLSTVEFIDNGKPVLFEPTDLSLNSNFGCVSIRNNELFLAGKTDYDDEKQGCPYITLYDLISKTKKWSHIYEDLEGFEIYSCCLSAIGTPLIELYDSQSSMSYLCSCGLLGEIPEKTLDALPRSSAITNVKAPDVTVILIDADGKEHKKSITFGEKITESDVKQWITDEDGFELDGKELFKWKVEDDSDLEEEKLVDVIWPYEIKDNSVSLYSVYRIEKPQSVKVIDKTQNSIKLSWDKNPFAAEYEIEWSRDKEFTSSEIKYKNITTNSEYNIVFEESPTVYGSTWYFRVRCHDVADDKSEDTDLFWSEWSSPVEETTDIPDFTITLHDSADNTTKYSVKYGTQVTASIVKAQLPEDFAVPTDKSFFGWKYKNTDGTYSNVTFPYTVSGDVDFYARYRINAPILNNMAEVDVNKITVHFSKIECASKYRVECSVDDFRNYSYIQTDSVDVTVTETSVDGINLSQLLPDTIYYFRVMAYDAENDEWSGYSNVLGWNTELPELWIDCGYGNSGIINSSDLDEYDTLYVYVTYNQLTYGEEKPIYDYNGWDVGMIWNVVENGEWQNFRGLSITESLELNSSCWLVYDCSLIRWGCPNNFVIGSYADKGCSVMIYRYKSE